MSTINILHKNLLQNDVYVNNKSISSILQTVNQLDNNQTNVCFKLVLK